MKKIFDLSFVMICIFLGLLLVLTLIINVSAYSSNTFNNSLTSENLTFTANQNITRYLSVPQNIMLMNGYLNLSGYGNGFSPTFIEQSLSQGVTPFNPIGWVQNSSETAVPYNCIGTTKVNTQYIWNISTNFTSAYNIRYSYMYGDSIGNNITLSLNYKDFNTNSWVNIINNNSHDKFCKIGTFNIPSDGILNNMSEFFLNVTYNDSLGGCSTAGNSCDGFSYGGGIYGLHLINFTFYQDNLNKSAYNLNAFGAYATNPFVKIDNINIWNYSGQFNQSNNKTNNLANYINSYLSSCSYIAGYCYVPFTFHSDTAGILMYSDLIFNNYGFIENSQTFNSPVTSQSNQNFKINITYDPNYYTTSTATLNYNGTIYSSSATISNGNTIFSSTFNVPQVSNLTNYTFFWNISLTNSSGTNYFSSNSYNQSVSNINFGICTSSLNVTYINFTIRDFTTKELINATFKSTWFIGNSSYQNYSYQDLSETNSSFAFCFSPSDSSYQVTSIIEYDNTIKAKNYYYLTNSILTNVTNNITLYLLNDSLTTFTQFLVEDRTRKPISDVYITIQSYDVGTDTFYTTGMLKTGYDGTDLAYLNWYDTLYRYTLVKDGIVIQATNSSKISSTPKRFLILSTTDFIYDKFSSMVYSLTFNNATNNLY
jgi:hypothetical protein